MGRYVEKEESGVLGLAGKNIIEPTRATSMPNSSIAWPQTSFPCRKPCRSLRNGTPCLV